jgi:uncharacterized PurR-regulated membrane protein YhhQ (DUF165 family)
MQRILTTNTAPIVSLHVACKLGINTTAMTAITPGKNPVAPQGAFIHAPAFTLPDPANERPGKQGARQMIYVALAANLPPAGYALQLGVLARNPNPSWNGGSPVLVAARARTGSSSSGRVLRLKGGDS